MLQGRFVYWKGLEPSKLLEYDSRLVAFMQELPFQEGKSLSCISEEGEGSTELVEYSHRAKSSSYRQVYMASLRNADDTELLADISAHERTVDPPQDETEEYRWIRRLKNPKRAKRRQNEENRARNPLYQRNINNAFIAARDREYRTPIGAIAEAMLLAQQLPPNPQIQRLQYQLDGQLPIFSTRNTFSRPECHVDSVQVSRTPRGGFGFRGNDNR
jgi:hypothetical protein